MCFKLAFRNVRRSVKDYTIYFLTLMFGVCLFYVFNSLGEQEAMLRINESQKSMLQLMSSVMSGFSVFISFILAGLILYANRFLMRRRKKELGIYMTLGMPKGKISRILILETFFIGLLALAVGLILGIFLSQLLCVVTAKLFLVQMKEFTFLFSMGALLRAILFFGIIFLVVMLFNSISISRCRLIDLLQAAKKNEKMKARHLWVSVLLFLISVACLGIAYWLILDNGLLAVNTQFKVSIALGIVGTFLFFYSLSGFLLRLVQTNKRIYLRKLNMFVLRQLNSKITTTFISMTLICLMLFISISTLSAGVGFTQTFNNGLRETNQFDATILWGDPYGDWEDSVTVTDGYEKLKQDGMEDYIQESAAISIYDSGVKISDLMTREAIEKQLGNTLEADSLLNSVLTLVPASQFNQVLQLQGKEPVALGENQFLINCNMDSVASIYERSGAENAMLTINGRQLASAGTISQVSYFNYTMAGDVGTLVVPDSIVEGLKPGVLCLDLNYAGDHETARQALSDYIGEQTGGAAGVMILDRQAMYENTAGLTTIVSYVVIYVGIVFLITCAAILALQQLSESSDNVERYQLLHKLGVDRRQMNHALLLQIGIYFLLPLLLAVIHSIVGISVANQIIQVYGKLDALSGILVTAGVMIAIYGGYCLATYLGSKSMIHSRQN